MDAETKNEFEKIKTSFDDLTIIVKESFDSLENRMGGLEEGFSGIRTELDSVHSELGLIRSDLDGVHYELKMIHSELGAIRSELCSINERLDGIEDKVARLTKMETDDISAVYKDLEMIKKRVADIEARLHLQY
jgi:predicted  nucleic acid-binding Zn-ribbon protein